MLSQLHRARTWSVVPAAALVCAAFALSAPADAATPAPVGASTYVPAESLGGTAQGIIMRDGGVCDPIRHMGC